MMIKFLFFGFLFYVLITSAYGLYLLQDRKGRYGVAVWEIIMTATMSWLILPIHCIIWAAKKIKDFLFLEVRKK